MNNKEKMLNGLVYEGTKDGLSEERIHTWTLIQKYNKIPVNNIDALDNLAKVILGSTGNKIRIKPPFYCDYGYNIHVGENFFANYNLTILDTANISIGDNVKIGPNVNIYAACHPIDGDLRASGIEFSKSVTIGNNVWIGGNTVVNPGVVIGDNTVIGSGSVVTKNIPDNVVAAGNPCKIIRLITEHDKIYYNKNKKY